jgi:signal peptidase I
VADPVRKIERARRSAEAFARDARRLARRYAKRLGKRRKEVDEAAEEVEAAAADAIADPERLSGALQRLDGLWEEHLGFTRRGPLREYGVPVLAAMALALLLRAFVVEPFRIPSGSMVPTLLEGDLVVVSKLAYGVRVPFTSLQLLRRETPRRGDVIVFLDPRQRWRDYVKRVVGLPGDVIEIREQVLFVNGVAQPRSAEGDLVYDERDEATGRVWRDTCRRYRESLAIGAVPRPASELPADIEASWSAASAQGVAPHAVLQCRRSHFGSREGPFEVVKPGHVFVMGDNRDRSSDNRSEGGWQVPLGAIEGKVIRIGWSWGRGGTALGSGAGVRFERLFKPVE